MTLTQASTGLTLSNLGTTLTNDGTLIVTSTGEIQPNAPASGESASIVNAAGGTIQLQGGGEIGFGNTAGPFMNAGLVKVSGGSGTATIDTNPFNNTGTVAVDGGTLALTFRVTQVTGSTLAAGTWEALNGSTIQFPTGTNLTTNQANVTLGGPGASIPAVAKLATNSGTFSVLGGAAFTTVGNLSNTGTLTVGPASTLTVKGNYTQSSAATLDSQLGGTPASAQFGQVTVTGAATFAGTLAAQVVAGYQPTLGDQFAVLTYPSATGGFSTFNLPTATAFSFQATMNAGSVVIAALGTKTDLATSSISSVTPATVTPGQNLTVAYSVSNLGVTTTISAWTDSVFLSTSKTLTSAAVLLGRVDHEGAVAGGGSYQATLTAPVPGLLPGNYFVLVEADSGGDVPDLDRANNVLASTQGSRSQYRRW